MMECQQYDFSPIHHKYHFQMSGAKLAYSPNQQNVVYTHFSYSSKYTTQKDAYHEAISFLNDYRFTKP